MRYKKNIMTASLSAFLMLCGCNSDSDIPMSPTPVEPVDTLPEKSFVPERMDSVNEAAFCMMRYINNDGAKSAAGFLFSPLSVTAMLAFLTDNAADNISQHLLQEMGLYGTAPNSACNFIRSTCSELENADPSITCRFRNGLYANTHVGYEANTFNDTFTRSLSVDFSAPDASAAINRHFKEGIWPDHFTDFFFDYEVTEDAPNALLNSLSFCAHWSKAFQIQKTREDVFHAGKNDVSIEMMEQNDSLPFSENERFKAVSIPFGKGRFLMTFILPTDVTEDAADNLISQLNSKMWFDLLQSMKKEAVCVTLPKIQCYSHVLAFREGEPCDLCEKSVLTGNNYPGLFGNVGDKGPVVWFARHRENITLNESGFNPDSNNHPAEDASVMECDKSFTANHPFLYVVHDTLTKSILFLGKFMKYETGFPAKPN